jgi:hypothetical protein
MPVVVPFTLPTTHFGSLPANGNSFPSNGDGRYLAIASAGERDGQLDKEVIFPSGLSSMTGIHLVDSTMTLPMTDDYICFISRKKKAPERLGLDF